jgi:geranylgeranyl pyrophosphate synthase
MQVMARAESIDAIPAEINTYLQRYYAQRSHDAETLHPLYGRLWDGLTQSHLSGGKRMRPHLLVLAYEAFGGTQRANVVPAAAAVELLHAAMLIHDDIIDRDQYRHGVPNVSGRYRSHYDEHITDAGERGHYADSAAMLGGDVLIADAFGLVAGARISAAMRIRLVHLLSEAVYRVAGGELLDVEATLPGSPVVEAHRIAELKTAFYSFSLPLEAGALLAGASASVCSQLRAIGNDIGVAFQLADDLLGMYGTTVETGKPVGNDLREGKRSMLIEYGLSLTTPTERSMLLRTLSNHKADEATLERIRSLLTACGARAAVEDRMRTLYTSAADRILALSIAEPDRAALLQVARHAIWRRS